MGSESKHLNGQVNNTIFTATHPKKEALWREGVAGWLRPLEEGAQKHEFAGMAHRTQANTDIPVCCKGVGVLKDTDECPDGREMCGSCLRPASRSSTRSS